LLPPTWRRRLPVLVALTVVWVAAWAVAVHGGRGPLGVERPLNDLLTRNRMRVNALAVFFTHVGDAPVIVVLSALLLGLCALGRTTRTAFALVVGLATTLVLCEGLKHLVGRRQIMHALCFPSGHVAVTSVFATVLVLLFHRLGPLGRRGQPHLGRAVVAVGGAAIVAVAAAMVITGDHYVTDTVTAAPMGISVTLLAAAAADFLAARSGPAR
jgi:hypothetical protein